MAGHFATTMNAIRSAISFCLLLIAVSSASEKAIDIKTADKLVLWKGAETGLVGAASITQKYVIYSASTAVETASSSPSIKGKKGSHRHWMIYRSRQI